jgi:hypothetical protein
MRWAELMRIVLGCIDMQARSLVSLGLALRSTSDEGMR